MYALYQVKDILIYCISLLYENTLKTYLPFTFSCRINWPGMCSCESFALNSNPKFL